MRNKHRILEGSRKKIVLGSSKEEEARRVHRKVKNASLKVDFRTCQSEQIASSDYNPHKAEARTEKERAKKVLILNLAFQPRKHPLKKEIASPRNQTIGIPASLTDLVLLRNGTAREILHGWMASVSLSLANHPTHVVLDLGCTLSIGSRANIRRFQKHVLHCAITTKFCPCTKSFVFANFETETFQQHLHVQSELICLRRATCLSYFSLSQMKNSGTTIELDPKGDKLTCPAFD